MRDGLDEMAEWHEQIGMEKGLEQGIKGFILEKLDCGETRETVRNKIIRYYEVSPEKAEEYLDKYIPVEIVS